MRPPSRYGYQSPWRDAIRVLRNGIDAERLALIGTCFENIDACQLHMRMARSERPHDFSRCRGIVGRGGVISSSRIHIVDDDEPVRTALLFVLEAVGFRVAGYVDAADFLARASSECGILICDVRMPGMKGIELTRLLTQRGSSVPIILMTGHASLALQSEAMSAGAQAMLEKPVELDALLAAIAEVAADFA